MPTSMTVPCARQMGQAVRGGMKQSPAAPGRPRAAESWWILEQQPVASKAYLASIWRGWRPMLSVTEPHQRKCGRHRTAAKRGGTLLAALGMAMRQTKAISDLPSTVGL
eukprot:5284340-Amphidinium_carterae.1